MADTVIAEEVTAARNAIATAAPLDDDENSGLDRRLSNSQAAVSDK
ncbi:hypothetical protein [Sphingobium sp. CR28]